MAQLQIAMDLNGAARLAQGGGGIGVTPGVFEQGRTKSRCVCHCAW
jgi:hypothetical protein